jgi:hypothetical protein
MSHLKIYWPISQLEDLAIWLRAISHYGGSREFRKSGAIMTREAATTEPFKKFFPQVRF